MAQYDSLAAFYDAVNGEPVDTVRHILSYIEEFLPSAHSVLELGCGTGAVLASLGSGFTLTGIDHSAAMLEFAHRRCPEATYIEGDITSFEFGQCFDVVLCVENTLNHLTDFAQWRSVFAHVARHLTAGGLFIFDLNTLGRLRELAELEPWVHDFDDHTLIMDVDFENEPLAKWNIRIFEALGEGTFRRHDETIVELGVALSDVRDALAEQFTVAAESDAEEGSPSDDSGYALFVARQR